MPNNDEMQSLVNLLNEAAKAYYTLDNPIMSDVEYDKLYDQLLQMKKTPEKSCLILRRNGLAGSRSVSLYRTAI